MATKRPGSGSARKGRKRCDLERREAMIPPRAMVSVATGFTGCGTAGLACYSKKPLATTRRPPAGWSPSVGAGPKALGRRARNLALS